MTASSRAVLAVHDALERGRTTVAELFRLRVYASVSGIPFERIRSAVERAQQRIASGSSYDEAYRSVLSVMGAR